MILKSDKSVKLAELFRSINLLSILLKLLLPKLPAIMEKFKLISNYQFSFRNKHMTMEQICRIVKRINKKNKNDMEAEKYYMTIFFDVHRSSTRSGTKNYFTKLKTVSHSTSVPS